MRVDWAIPCRYAEVGPNGATIVGAGADVVMAPEVPVPVQMLFAVRFVGDPDELDGAASHRVAARLFDTAGQLVGEQAGEMTGDVNLIVPGYVAHITVPMGIVIDAQQHGTYSVEFQIDDDSLRVPIHVVEPPNPS